MNKREAAKSLYINENLDQKEIAKLLGVSPNTVTRWKQEDKWGDVDMLRNSSTMLILELIAYQTQALKRKKDQWLEEDNQTTNLIEKGDIDALQKLHSTVRNDARKFNDYVIVMKEFFEFLQDEDLDAAKKLTPIADMFLNEKRKQL